jgi:hypothetical protein
MDEMVRRLTLMDADFVLDEPVLRLAEPPFDRLEKRIYTVSRKGTRWEEVACLSSRDVGP